MVEIRKFGQGTAEEIVTTLTPDVRLANGVASYLYRDQLGSVRVISNTAGALAERRIYHPFGEMESWDYDLATADETRGWIGTRYDAGAGLQYLNARYYDPRLGPQRG